MVYGVSIDELKIDCTLEMITELGHFDISIPNILTGFVKFSLFQLFFIFYFENI